MSILLRASRLAALVVALLIGNVACSDDAKIVPRPNPPIVDRGPIVDQPPYFCDFIPQEAFRRVSGFRQPIAEDRSGWKSTDGLCDLKNQYDRLSLDWQNYDGKNILRLAHKNFDRKRIASLPTDLGDGLIAYTGEPPRTRPYYTMMLFRCGDKKPWISIDLSEVAKGRDPVKDLTDLLRIARQRYGKLHKCEPKPR